MMNKLFELKHLHVNILHKISRVVGPGPSRRGEARRKWRAGVVCVAV